ncbi:hypothetical protein JCM8547_003570 [Rhodosporidiobolus lusitaniae]
MSTIAFLGATGGCTLAVLVRAVNAGTSCRALVRTPSKLVKLLVEDKKVPQEKVDQHLVILQGDATSVEDVKKLFEGPAVSVVVSGIGAYPKMQASLTTPFTLEDPHLCTKSASSLIAALSSLPASMPKPIITMISTTGISAHPVYAGLKDVPFLLHSLYSWGLHVMHEDKRDAEEVLRQAAKERKSGGFVIVRASLLVDSETGSKKTRVGWEEEGGKPAVGYTVGRDAVGEWIYEEVVKDEEKRKEWVGRHVTLTW